MRKVFMAVFALLISVAFVSAVFAQAKPQAKPAGAPEKAPTAEKPVGVPDKPEGTPAPDKPKPKPKPKGVFMGVVTSVNAPAKMVTVKSNSGTPGEIGDVTFDLTNAKLKGYKGIGDIKAGDKVSVKYTKDGVTVDKMGGPKAAER